MLLDKLYLLKVTSKEDSLECQISSYILKHKKELAHRKKMDIITDMGVSKSTLSRFCKEMGFKNFTDLQMQLELECSRKVNYVTRFTYSEKEEELFKKIQKHKRIIVTGNPLSLCVTAGYKSIFDSIGVNLLVKLDASSQYDILQNFQVSQEDIVLMTLIASSKLDFYLNTCSQDFEKCYHYVIDNKIPHLTVMQRMDPRKIDYELSSQGCVHDAMGSLSEFFEKLYKYLSNR